MFLVSPKQWNRFVFFTQKLEYDALSGLVGSEIYIRDSAEAAANLLTNAVLDPFGKIPEFKYCAVAVQALQ